MFWMGATGKFTLMAIGILIFLGLSMDAILRKGKASLWTRAFILILTLWAILRLGSDLLNSSIIIL